MQTADKAATKTEMVLAFQVIVAATEAIREAREIPAGTLYAMLMNQMDLASYEKMERLILNTGLVAKRGHLLRWVGPRF